MRDNFTRTAWSTSSEILIRDTYLFKQWPSESFDFVIDIGANVGIFTVLASMRHWDAQVYAYEPCLETFKELERRTQHLPNIHVEQAALGNGEDLVFYDTTIYGANLFYEKEMFDEFYKDKQESSYPVPSYTLPQIIKRHDLDINKKYYIKIDCEGGERFLLNDGECDEIIKNAGGVGMEIHFPGLKKEKEKYLLYKHFPKWEEYNNWLQEKFSDTHKIFYHHSSKGNGLGMFVLTKKVN